MEILADVTYGFRGPVRHGPGSANRGEEKDLIFLPLPYQSFGSTIGKHQI